MKHSIVTITPQMAELMLENNNNNRKLDDRIVAQYARDMTNGAWKINGESIKFSSTGKLLDGQHRLHGCVRSGKNLVTMMVEGLDDNSFTTIDVGKKRTAGQILAIAGHVNTNHLAAAVRLIRAVERNNLRPNMSTLEITMTSQQILEWVEINPFIGKALQEGSRIKRLCSVSAGTAAYWLMWTRDPELTHKYFVQLFAGENLKRGDPALAVRNALINFERTVNPGAWHLAILIRGWNAIRAGRELTEVRGFVRNKGGEYNAVEIE